MTSPVKWLTPQCSRTSWALISKGQVTMWKSLTVNSKSKDLLTGPRQNKYSQPPTSQQCKLAEGSSPVGQEKHRHRKTPVVRRWRLLWDVGSLGSGNTNPVFLIVLCVLYLKHIIPEKERERKRKKERERMGGRERRKRERERTTVNKKQGFRVFSLTLAQKPRASIRGLSGPAITACHFPFPGDTGGLTSRSHWELEWREGLGTLNLVGWLCGTLSLSRQLQQLPMVSEQPIGPRERQEMSRSPAALPSCSVQNTAPVNERVLCPTGWMTQTHLRGFSLNPWPNTLGININLS